MFKHYDRELFHLSWIYKSCSQYSSHCRKISSTFNFKTNKYYHYKRAITQQCCSHKYNLFHNQIVKVIDSKIFFHTTNFTHNKIIQFNLADIGEGIREVSIKYWNDNIKIGNHIDEFDELCEVESDKASVTITSKYSGIIRKIYYDVGDVALVGKPLIDIEVDNDVIDSKQETCESLKSETSTEIKSSGQCPKIIPSTQNTQSQQSLNSTKESLTVRNSPGTEQDDYVFRNNWKKILATPSVRRMIKEYNVNIKDIIGTGKHGRVLKHDVIDFVQMKKNQNAPMINEVKANIRTDGNKQEDIIPIKGYIKGMFKSMSEANEIPSLKLTEVIDVTDLKLLRQDMNEFYKDKAKLTYMPFFIKALSLCISEHPILNSTIDYENNNIVIKQDHNICVAIDTPHGLVVPNIKRVQDLNIIKLSEELKRLQNDAQNYKVSATDLSAGTISISNVGNISGLLVQPIIVPKQVCIIAFGRIQVVPAFVKDTVVPRSMIHITWAADHRVIDGATTARASKLFKQYIEKPSILLANQ